MAKAYVLSEADVILLRELAQERRKQVTGLLRPRMPEPDPTAPETYIARTPATGIEALQEATGVSTLDTPGWASCDIYRIIGEGDDARLHEVGAGLSKIVYNLSHERIGGRRWAVVSRDKFGRWIIAGPPSPDPDVGDTGTGTDITPTDPPYDNTGTGTGPDTGGPGGIYYPCPTIPVEETDVFCEPASVSILHAGGGLGTGTGTDTDNIADNYYLNLYRRTILLAINTFTGCLERTALPWEYVRTIGCCEPECTEPDTGTGQPPHADDCCDGDTLAATVGYTITGVTAPFCQSCTLTGELHQTNPPDGFEWTNSSGGSTCGGRSFLDLTLYCSGTQWRARGKLRRYLPKIEDTTQTFDVALTEILDGADLLGTVTATGCGGSTFSILINNPCVSDDDNPEGTIGTACCPDDLLPETLTATITAPGDCSAWGGSYTITWDGVAYNFTGTVNGQSFGISLICMGSDCNGWQLAVTCGAGGMYSSTGLTSCSCNPFMLVYPSGLEGDTSCCTDENQISVTITE